MGYAWAPQITGLVRGEPKPGARHRSNGLAIFMEAMEERASKSPTLDRTRSHKNPYWHRDGGPSGTATWEAMCEAADAYRIPVTLKNGKTAERGLRGDAVIGWAAILKPPPEMVAELGMTGKDIRRFCDDGFRALEQIEPRVFRDENLEAVAGHVDEDTPHYHFLGTSKDKAGKYCGNLIDANLCVRINEQFPAIMRGLGWPIDDLDMTDWERMKTDEEYRAEREAKRKRQGQSVKQYGKQRAENAGRVAAKIITDAQDEAQAIKEKAVEDAKTEAAGIKAQAVRDAKKEAEAASLEVAANWERSVLLAKQEKAGLEREIGDMKEYRTWKAQKAAQEAERKAKEEREAQEAKEAKEAEKRRQDAEKARERERQQEQARRAVKEAARPKTDEERYQEARAAIFGGSVATPPPVPPKRSGGSILDELKRQTEARARDASKDGPSYPGS